MPIWLSLLEIAVKMLIWAYGHKAVLEKTLKYTPLPVDPNPGPAELRHPTRYDG